MLLFLFLVFQEVIYKVKAAFNEEFDIVVQKKEQEIARVKERNLKIQEILEQLDLQVELWEPVLTDDEMPERVLTVQDSEVSEKCIFVFDHSNPAFQFLSFPHIVSVLKNPQADVSVYLKSSFWPIFFPFLFREKSLNKLI